MEVPAPVVYGVVAAGAAVFGWTLHDAGSDAGGSAPAYAADRLPISAAAPSDDAPVAPVVNLTVAQPAPATPVVDLTVDQPASPPPVDVRLEQEAWSTSSSHSTFAAVHTDDDAGPASPAVIVAPVQEVSGERPATTVSATSETAAGPNSSVNVSGQHIVVASDGSIVFVGDDGALNGNTGDVSSSGTVGIDVEGSELTSGSSGSPPVPRVEEWTTAAGPAPHGTGAATTSSPRPRPGGRAVSIAGYEDHSVTVVGNDQVILYDDSNVFLDRDGQINANTGDTDSSGLNVVDAVDSIIRSGNSGDGEGGDEDDGDEEEVDEVGARTTRPRPTPSPPAGRAQASVDDEDVSTSASGDDVVVIGGDGYDDLAIRSFGDRNVVVYDDSNLVIGGTGGVNAQIGDSDTGGAVVMGVRGSLIEAGCEGDLCPLYERQRP